MMIKKIMMMIMMIVMINDEYDDDYILYVYKLWGWGGMCPDRFDGPLKQTRNCFWLQNYMDIKLGIFLGKSRVLVYPNPFNPIYDTK